MYIAKAMLLTILLTSASSGLWGQQHNAVSVATGSVADPASGNSHPGDDRPALQQRNPRYQVQRDDVLIISFALSPELNQTVTIQPDGYINLQNAGSVYVQGMTVPDVVAAIKKTYANTLHDPIIDVDLKDFQKPYFVAFGQVGKPGQYDLRYDMTLSEAIDCWRLRADCENTDLSLPSRKQRMGRGAGAQDEGHPAWEKCQRRRANHARRHDFCTREIYYEIPKVCSVLLWCRFHGRWRPGAFLV